MTEAEIEALVGALLSPDHRQPINEKAKYRTRDVTLFEDAATALRSLASENTKLRKALEPFLRATSITATFKTAPAPPSDKGDT